MLFSREVCMAINLQQLIWDRNLRLLETHTGGAAAAPLNLNGCILPSFLQIFDLFLFESINIIRCVFSLSLLVPKNRRLGLVG